MAVLVIAADGTNHDMLLLLRLIGRSRTTGTR